MDANDVLAFGKDIWQYVRWVWIVVGPIYRFMKSLPADPPLFDSKWWLFDKEDATTAVGTAAFQRTWRQGVRGRWHRSKDRSGADADRLYLGRGFLQDRKLILNWVAADRPDTFGVLVLTADEDFRVLTGLTVLTPHGATKPEAIPIWFKRIPR